MPHYFSRPVQYYSRHPGLDFIHDEASNGSSRTDRNVTRLRVSITPGMIVATRSADDGIVPFDPEGSDGSQVATGIAVSEHEHREPRDDRRRGPLYVSTLSNRADVVGSLLTWPAGITPEQRAAAVAQLAVLGIAVV